MKDGQCEITDRRRGTRLTYEKFMLPTTSSEWMPSDDDSSQGLKPGE
jgi:hypothetical protein